MTRRFTGRHMTMVMVAFFAVVIGVNVTMARYAIGTFGGTVVENSYVASQRYNEWLAQARRQTALGWTPVVTTDPARHLVISITTSAGQLDGARISATATHPLGALPSRALAFDASLGAYRSRTPLPAGRWLIHIVVAHGATTASYDDEIGS